MLHNCILTANYQPPRHGDTKKKIIPEALCLVAEPLQENFANVLQENLSALLSTDRILRYPWKRPSLLDYQLSLDVIQFDGTKSQEAVLKVRWTLVGDDGETLLVKKTSHFTEPVGGLDYEDFVQAMSRTLDSLSQEIANAIKGLPSVSS